MPRTARFWRNVTIIAVVHIAIVLALVRWNRELRKPKLQSIVWMSGGGADVAASTPARTEKTTEEIPQSERDEPTPEREEQREPPVEMASKSDIQISLPTPAPVPAPSPKLTASPIPRASPEVTKKPLPKSTPGKPAKTRPAPKPSPKNKTKSADREKKSDERKKETVKIAPARINGTGEEKSASIGPGATVRASEFSWYGKMLHDRFYSDWVQPRTSVPVGAKMSALVRIRIERNGRISKFTIVKPSGNVVVDESVAAVAKRVTYVEPLPKGVGSGAYYEVNIKFELNPEP